MEIKKEEGIISVGTILVFLAVWIPFLWLSFYNVPIGMHEWDAMTNNGGTMPRSWWDIQAYMYNENTGRYTSNAVSSLTSTWCTLSTFPYFFFLWQIGWMVTIAWMVRKMLENHPWRIVFLVAIGIQMIYLSQLEDVYDSMFRYAAVITYQLGAILWMTTGIAFISFEKQERKNKWVLFGALTLMSLAIGTNEVSMMIILLISVVLVIYHYFFKKEYIQPYIIASLIAIVCSAIVVFAPSNGLRIDSENGGLSVLQTLTTTIGATLYLWFDWLSSGILLLMTILAIPFLGIVVSGSRGGKIFNDYRPWLWILILIVPVAIAPLMYVMGGDTFPERVIDHLFFHVIVIWLGLLIALWNKFNLYQEVERLKQNKAAKFGYATCLVFVLLFIFGQGINVNRNDKANRRHYIALLQSGSNVTNAWLTLVKGEAQLYHRESMQELNKLFQCTSDTCFILKPKQIPAQLYDPLSDRRNKNGDRYIGYYFNKNIKRVMYKKE